MSNNRSDHVLVVHPDGNFERCELAGNVLAVMQGLVGGYVERVKLNPNDILLVNDEGAVNGMPRNELAEQVATLLMAKNKDDSMPLFQTTHSVILFGPVVFASQEGDRISGVMHTTKTLVELFSMNRTNEKVGDGYPNG